ncbi:MAG: RNA pseudouridine synthase [Polyangia bacterium]
MDDLRVLRRSDDELVVCKPAGLASEARDPRAESVLAMVASALPGSAPKLPHRLDRVTRGILLVCLSPGAVAFHGEQIKARRWAKYYLARVASDPRAFIGQHRAFLGEEKGRAVIVRSGGKPAWLEILDTAPVPASSDRWHVLIHLQTGRFHQIRVMLAALGIPLPGDTLYGGRDSSDFYLEHVLLRYTAFASRELVTVFERDDADRGPVAPSLMGRLVELAA